MVWQVGQKVVCDRPGRQLVECVIQAIGADQSVLIVCASTNTVVCGQRHHLERLGWRVLAS